MTEDEAKTKWCPFARTIILGNGGSFIGPANRAVGAEGKEGPEGPKCIASACMAWRWQAGADPATLADWNLRTRADRVRPAQLGGCGLAGAPQ